MPMLPRAPQTPKSDPLGRMLWRARYNVEPPLTQEQVAAELGVTQSTVSSWESGRLRPNVQMLSRLADLLELDFDELADVGGFTAI